MKIKLAKKKVFEEVNKSDSIKPSPNKCKRI